MRRLLMRMARSILQSVLQGLVQQLNVVEQMAMAPLKMMVQQVVGGAWKGQGADAFVNEVTSLLVPNVETVKEHIGNTSKNLDFARTRVEQGDQSVEQLIRSRLTDAFKFY
jgi:uncharacterized protein YukE